MLVIIYAVGVVVVPIVTTVIDSPNPDPSVFVLACACGLCWPVLAPFMLLWLAGKELGKLRR